MRNTRFLWIMVSFMLVSFCLSHTPVFAREIQDVAELKKQIEALQKRVDELETEKQQQLNSEPGTRFPSRMGFGWDPWEEMERMQAEMDRMFQDSFGRSGMGQGMFSSNMSFDYDFDITETDKEYEITFDMAGLNDGKIDFQINEHSLTIKGEHSQEEEEKGPAKFMRAKNFGSFMKTIPLPPDADTAKVKTEKKGSSFIIRLPKKKSQV